MIFSMTAFGRDKRTVSGKDITVELRSVNNRFFDCSVRMPRAFSYLEEKIKPYLQSRGISRGKVDVSISIDVLDTQGVSIVFDEGYAKGYLDALYALRDTFHLQDDISVMTVARNPEIFKVKKPEEDVEKDWQDLLEVLSVATDRFLDARRAEGARIEADLRAKMQNIMTRVDTIEALSADDIVTYRDRLEEKIRAVLTDAVITVDENRLLTECAIYADKVAIDEELVRLRSHFVAFEQYLSSDQPVGRSIDFLLQEVNREINTTGSKCTNAAIAKLVVEVKTELEKIREQIQNIE